jgi:hypothetical protein
MGPVPLPTPRTDAQLGHLNVPEREGDYASPRISYVRADFARQLERELRAMTEDAVNARRDLIEMTRQRDENARELTELKEKYGTKENNND